MSQQLNRRMLIQKREEIEERIRRKRERERQRRQKERRGQERSDAGE